MTITMLCEHCAQGYHSAPLAPDETARYTLIGKLVRCGSQLRLEPDLATTITASSLVGLCEPLMVGCGSAPARYPMPVVDTSLSTAQAGTLDMGLLSVRERVQLTQPPVSVGRAVLDAPSRVSIARMAQAHLKTIAEPARQIPRTADAWASSPSAGCVLAALSNT
jgi:hypothetical protein